ncbi:ElyC/SanA/YdcF family protein [Vallitaleaceae bacterium 9-2]
MQRLKRMLNALKRLLVRLIRLSLVALVIILAINGYVVFKYRERIITLEEAKAKDVDCILVLGAAVWGGTRPSPMLQDRLDKGIELYNQGASPRMLMSGDHGGQYYDEVNVMKNYAMDAGIEDSHIFMDHAGFSTYESMIRAKEVFEVDSVIIVTQGYHLSRALYVANELGLEAYGVASDPRKYNGQFYRDLREMAARVKDFGTALLKPQPTYLGEVIPISGSGEATND